MAKEATTTTRPAESSSQRIDSSSLAPQAKTEVTLLPPAYLSSKQKLDQPRLDSSNISTRQTNYNSAVSNGIKNLPQNQTPSDLKPPVKKTPVEPAAQDKASSGTKAQGVAKTQDGDNLEKSTAATAVGTGKGAAGPASTSTENIEQKAPVLAATAAETLATGAASGAATSVTGGANDEDDKNMEVVVAKLPNLAPLVTPWVFSPPTQAIERRNEIIKRTGTSPEQHHANVRQATERATEAARTAQRRMVWQLGNVARSTRISIEDMAEEIPKVTASAVKQIKDAVKKAGKDITESAKAESDHIANAKVLTGKQLETSQNTTKVDIVKQLKSASVDVQQLYDIAIGQFNNRIGEAKASISAVPASGKGQLLLSQKTAKAEEKDSKLKDQRVEKEKKEGSEKDKTNSYKIVTDTKAPLEAVIKSQTDIEGSAGAKTQEYMKFRVNPVLEGMSTNKDKELVGNANSLNSAMDSESSRAEFSTLVLGLTTPQSKHHGKDKSNTIDPVIVSKELNMTAAEAAVFEAQLTIEKKRDQAIEYCDKDLQDKLVENIHKTGHKAYQGLREQAATSEVALVNSAIPMAVAYRDLVSRLNALLPPNQFLDSRGLVPKLLAARDSAEKLRSQHELGAKRQAAETIEQMAEVKKDQVNGIIKAGQEAAASVNDVFIQSAFDMVLFSGQMTGKMSENSANAIKAAEGYASKVAKSLLATVNNTKETGLDNLDESAVSYLNGYISSTEKSQYKNLEGFVKQMEVSDGPLVQSIKGTKGDLERRAAALQDAMPESSTATAAGLAAIPVVGVIAAGVYVYCKDANENKVLQQLGNLVWPGVPALAEVFENGTVHYGSLEGRIKSRMAEPQKTTALTLLKGSEQERIDARVDAIKNSTGLLDYNSRETREALAQGMEKSAFGTDKIKNLSNYLENELNINQAEISTAYLSGDTERVVAARTKENLDKGQKEGEWGWIFSAESAQKRSDEARVDAIGKMDSILHEELKVRSDFVDESQMQEKNNKVIREFAVMISSGKKLSERTEADQAKVSMDFARSQFKGYATKSHLSSVIGLSNLAGIPNIEKIDMGKEAKNYISAEIDAKAMDVKDDDTKVADAKEKAKIAKGIFEFTRAKEDGKPSQTTQIRLSDTFENRDLATYLRKEKDPKTPPEERLKYKRLAEEARAKNQRIMQGVAVGVDPNAPKDPQKAEVWMADQMAAMFGNTQTLGDYLGITHNPSHARYGREMIMEGRASLEAGVALATEGLGTHEDLLLRSYTDRTHAEIKAANKNWKKERGEDMEEMLGIKKRDLTAEDKALLAISPVAWFATRGAETSGDLAMQLKRLSYGNRESDLDYVKYAALHYNQERVEGTGFIAKYSMRGTAEQQSLDAQRDQLARTILAVAKTQDPEIAAQFEKNPGTIFDADGNVNAAVKSAAFDGDGKLRDKGSALLRSHSEGISYAAEAYHAEIDRQEAMLTTGITVLALITSIALMVVPGVNIVAAGIISAIVAGAATIAVKAGMRGNRYGWEEAATDIATTAIEAATAGIGGSLAGGLGKTGALAKIGEGMIARLGKVGGAMAREAIVSAVSSAASTAIQDDTWKDGLGRGLERVANGAIRGAVVAAISTGVSEGITQKLSPALHVGEIDPSKIKAGTGMAERLGPHSREMFREALTNSINNMAGETAGLLIDYSSGQFHGTFLEAISHVGMSGMREMMVGAARGGIMSMHRATYRNLLEVARSGVTLTEPQLHALRAFGISAGALHYDQDMNHVLKEVHAARALLERMPPNLREQAKTFDLHSLQSMAGMLEQASLGDIGQLDGKGNLTAKAKEARETFISELTSSVPDLDPHALMHELAQAVQRRQNSVPNAELDPTQQSHLREQLGTHLHEGAKIVLKNIPLESLQHLSDVELAKAAAMIGSGKFNSAHADELLHAAQTKNPHLDEFSFLSSLHKAVSNSQQFQEKLTSVAATKRRGILAMIPTEAAPIFTLLPDADVALAHKLIQAGEPGNPKEQAALLRAAQTANPELSSEKFQGFMEAAASQVRQRMETENQARRTAREVRMTQVPEELRGTLSALPEAGLMELRLRQMEGELSPADKVRLLEMAQRETPGVDPHILGQALEQAVKHPPAELATEAQTADMRRHLLSAIPAEQKSLIEHTRIMVVPAEEFAAFTRSKKGQAVTLIINGEPVVVVREGANPRVLREEGIHALQAQDPRWAKHIGALDERSMAQWDSLPLEQQIELYRNKVALELDAQAHLIRGLESDIEKASSRSERRELEQHLAQVKGAFENLSRRSTEVGGMDALDITNIKAGFSERPQWLEQPARLFSKEEEAQQIPPKNHPEERVLTPLSETERQEQEDLVNRLAQRLKKGGEADTRWRQTAVQTMDLNTLRTVVNLHTDPEVVRNVFSLAQKSQNPKTFIEQVHFLAGHLDAETAVSITRKNNGEHLLNALVELHQQSTPQQAVRILKLASSDQIIDSILGVKIHGDGKTEVHQLAISDIHKILSVSDNAPTAKQLINIAAESANSSGFVKNLYQIFNALPETNRSELIARVAAKEQGQIELTHQIVKVINSFVENSALGSRMAQEILQNNHSISVVESLNSILSSDHPDARNEMVKLLSQSLSNQKTQQVLSLLHNASLAPEKGISLTERLKDHPQVLCDIIRFAAKSSRHLETLSRITQIAHVASNHQPSLVSELHGYIKTQMQSGSEAHLRSLHEMARLIEENGGKITPEVINALKSGNSLVTARVIAPVPADLQKTNAPPDIGLDHVNLSEAAKKFVEDWHKFMLGNFTVNTVNGKTRAVSESYGDFVGFLMHQEGLNLSDDQIHAALHETIQSLLKKEKELNVDTIRHGFKEQFKEQILTWVLHGDPHASGVEPFAASDPTTRAKLVAASLKRLESLTNHELNVKDRANLVELWYAAYHESFTGTRLKKPTLREIDNPRMVQDKEGVEIPGAKTDKGERYPDFADPPTLHDVKSHESSLSDEDDIRLRTYLRAASAEGGAKVRIGGESPTTFDKVHVAFTNSEGAEASVQTLTKLLNDYKEHFNFSFFNPHTGVEEIINATRLKDLGVNKPYTPEAIRRVINHLRNPPP